jgi:hypothetical protein
MHDPIVAVSHRPYYPIYFYIVDALRLVSMSGDIVRLAASTDWGVSDIAPR